MVAWTLIQALAAATDPEMHALVRDIARDSAVYERWRDDAAYTLPSLV